MNISFKGTYAISGNDILHKPYGKLEKFIDVTKPLRDDSYETLLNPNTFDYFVKVKDENEKAFESMVQKHKINCHKVKTYSGFPVIKNSAFTVYEMTTLLDKIIELHTMLKNG